MSNPNINFRLPPYQIARGLWIIRKLEPTYKPSSISQIVKLLYLDYLAKMSINRSDVIPINLLEEVKILASRTKKKELQLGDLIKQKIDSSEPATNTSEKESSLINTPTDLKPLAEWLNNLEEE